LKKREWAKPSTKKGKGIERPALSEMCKSVCVEMKRRNGAERIHGKRKRKEMGGPSQGRPRR